MSINSSVGPELEVDLKLDHISLEMFIASQAAFSCIGAFAASSISERLGRRRAFAVAAFTFTLGIFIMVSSTNLKMLFFGNFFLGLGIGFGLAADPIYIAEIAPARHRGRLVTWAETGINIGVIIGYLAGYFLSRFPPAQAWRAMYLSGIVMPLMMIMLSTCVMPESPRWLVMKDRLKEAEEVLQTVSPSDVDPSSTLAEIQESIRQSLQDGEKVRWCDIFCPSKGVRAMLLAGVGTAGCQQMCGIEPILFFIFFVMGRAGIKTKSAQFQFMLVLGLAKLILTYVGGKILDKAGRRPSILCSVAGMAVACFVLSIHFALGNRGIPQVALAMLLMYVGSFSLGMGPGAWLVATEVFPTMMRTKTMSVATISNRAVASFMTSIALSIANTLTWAGYFAVLTLINLAILAFENRYLPETKGKTLEELASHFARISGESDAFMLSNFTAHEQQPQEKQPQEREEPPSKIGRSPGTDADA